MSYRMYDIGTVLGYCTKLPAAPDANPDLVGSMYFSTIRIFPDFLPGSIWMGIRQIKIQLQPDSGWILFHLFLASK